MFSVERVPVGNSEAMKLVFSSSTLQTQPLDLIPTTTDSWIMTTTTQDMFQPLVMGCLEAEAYSGDDEPQPTGSGIAVQHLHLAQQTNHHAPALLAAVFDTRSLEPSMTNTSCIFSSPCRSCRRESVEHKEHQKKYSWEGYHHHHCYFQII